MGQRQSKEAELHQQVKSGNSIRIKVLHRDGASLELTDKEGKTPLMAACLRPELYDVAKTLVKLGANVNAYRPGHLAGTPLHHAAISGVQQTVKLLLSHGANALMMNDDGQTPLDVARKNGHSDAVRAIESHICKFSGTLVEIHGLVSRKVWVVVVPCASRVSLVCRVPPKTAKFELAIYSSVQDAQPHTIVALWKASMEKPDISLFDPTITITNDYIIPECWRTCRGIADRQVATKTRIKLAAENESGKEQLQRLYNAWEELLLVMDPAFPLDAQVHAAPATTPPEEVKLLPEFPKHKMPSQAPHLGTHPGSEADASTIGTVSECLTAYSGSSVPAGGACDRPGETQNTGSSSSCIICMDNPIEGACVPCGHMAGCLSCLHEIETKKWGCPVCSAKINQVIRIYTV